MTRLIASVRSGGQSGCDQGALRGAKAAGIPTGGWAPKGWRTEDGPAPWLAEFGLVQHASDTYAGRTVANVRESDGTLIIGDPTSSGSAMTIATCKRFHLPHLTVRWTPDRGPVPSPLAVAAIQRWLAERKIVVLNVAGNRESGAPGIEVAAFGLVRAVLS